jgi:hypothetical protein
LTAGVQSCCGLGSAVRVAPIWSCDSCAVCAAVLRTTAANQMAVANSLGVRGRAAFAQKGARHA